MHKYESTSQNNWKYHKVNTVHMFLTNDEWQWQQWTSVSENKRNSTQKLSDVANQL